METSAAPSKKISVSDVIGEAFAIYRDNAAPLLGIAVVVLGVAGLAEGILNSIGGFFLVLLGVIISAAAHALYTGFVVKLVQDVRDGRRDEEVEGLLSAAMPAILPLIGFGILFGIAVGIGFLLLVIPGLVLITFWSLGAPSIVVEREGVIGAFGRSWNLVRGQAWSVFATLIVVLLIVIVVAAVLIAIGAAIGTGGLIVASIVSSVITAPVFAIAVSVMFFDLGGGRAPAVAAAGQGQPSPVEPPPPAEPPPAV